VCRVAEAEGPAQAFQGAVAARIDRDDLRQGQRLGWGEIPRGLTKEEARQDLIPWIVRARAEAELRVARLTGHGDYT
jgi:DNA-nicking Smr family endonuclease